MEGIGKEGELVRTSEKKWRGQVKLARVSGGRRRGEKEKKKSQLFAQTLGRVQSNHTAIQSKAGGFELWNKQWL